MNATAPVIYKDRDDARQHGQNQHAYDRQQAAIAGVSKASEAAREAIKKVEEAESDAAMVAAEAEAIEAEYKRRSEAVQNLAGRIQTGKEQLLKLEAAIAADMVLLTEGGCVGVPVGPRGAIWEPSHFAEAFAAQVGGEAAAKWVTS
jgi:hypothetical protein